MVQHTITLLLELCQRVGDHARAVAAGEWTRAPDFSFWLAPPLELSGLTLGIVGFGRIGRRVAVVAQALGMRVIAAGGTGRREETGDTGVVWRSLPELFATADAGVGGQLCAFDVRSHMLGIRVWDERVGIAMNDERGSRDLIEPPSSQMIRA